MFLIINAAGSDRGEIMLADAAGDFKIREFSGRRREAEKLLKETEEFMRAEKIGHAQIKGLGLVSGAGGFTALRLAAAAVNALALAWKIPVVGIKADEFKDNGELVKKIIGRLKKTKAGSVVLPEYGGEPNITLNN